MCKQGFMVMVGLLYSLTSAEARMLIDDTADLLGHVAGA